MNLYGFVGNNPINKIDPFGLDDHHIVPQTFWEDNKMLSKEVRTIFDKEVIEAGYHGWTTNHKKYNGIVKEMWGAYFRGMRPEDIKPEHAKAFIKLVKNNPEAVYWLEEIIKEGMIRNTQRCSRKGLSKYLRKHSGKFIPVAGEVLFLIDIFGLIDATEVY